MRKREIAGEFQIVIAGAGPAGSSLAVRLAELGFGVCLIERETFPRRKLCGEFISPECLDHFRELGVLNEMLAAGGDRIAETVFYSTSGRHVSVPSGWFGGSEYSALSLSRWEMDLILLRRAESAGVTVLAGHSVTGLMVEDGEVAGVHGKNAAGEPFGIRGGYFVDATGRKRVLSKLAAKQTALPRFKENLSGLIPRIKGGLRGKFSGGRKLVGFKTHFDGVDLAKGRCEIYFFPGGYGGLSYVEDGAANHCFLLKAAAVKAFGGDADKILRELIFRNPRARRALGDARRQYEWLAVSIDGFGARDPAPAANLFSVGDSAAFIDPFTGSGMLMALESAEILAETIRLHRGSAEIAASIYRAKHTARFQKRLRTCSVMRRLAFVPALAGSLIFALSLSESARQILARNTRSGASNERI